MYTILTRTRLTVGKKTSHTSPSRNTVEENNMNDCEKEKKCGEVVKQLQMACYTHLSLTCLYACFLFALCNGKFLIFARDLGISSVHTCKKTKKHMLIYSPRCQVCKFTYGLLHLCKSSQTHMHVSVSRLTLLFAAHMLLIWALIFPFPTKHNRLKLILYIQAS